MLYGHYTFPTLALNMLFTNYKNQNDYSSALVELMKNCEIQQLERKIDITSYNARTMTIKYFIRPAYSSEI